MAARPSYQAEPAHLREPIWEAGFITPLQLMRIAAWKSARGLAPLTMNAETEIEDRTCSALQQVREWRHRDVLADAPSPDEWTSWRTSVAAAVGSKVDRTGLLGLEGFGYPMATAFLAILAPGAFPVIDRWTVKAVYGTTSRNYQRSHVYAHFAQTLALHADRFPSAENIHQVDQRVMAAAMGCEHVGPCGCVPFAPVAMPRTEVSSSGRP